MEGLVTGGVNTHRGGGPLGEGGRKRWRILIRNNGGQTSSTVVTMPVFATNSPVLLLAIQEDGTPEILQGLWGHKNDGRWHEWPKYRRGSSYWQRAIGQHHSVIVCVAACFLSERKHLKSGFTSTMNTAVICDAGNVSNKRELDQVV